MHTPKAFEVKDRLEIRAFIEANGFGQLISQGQNRLQASHLPLILKGATEDDEGKLLGHLGRQNSQWQGLDGQEVLATFQGPHDYISPSWYTSAGVPIWNYQAVHVYGECRVFDDAGSLKELVNALSDQYESASATPWQPNYPESMLKAIVGLEIRITEVQCQYKLSQNRPAADRMQVIEALEKRGSFPLATAMRNKT